MVRFIVKHLCARCPTVLYLVQAVPVPQTGFCRSKAQFCLHCAGFWIGILIQASILSSLLDFPPIYYLTDGTRCKITVHPTSLQIASFALGLEIADSVVVCYLWAR